MPERPEGVAAPLDSTQQLLFDALEGRGIAGRTILEIGGGDGRLEPADITILDKVVHCDHDPDRLIRRSTSHTRSLCAVAFPAHRRFLRLVLLFRVRSSPPDTIRARIGGHGLERAFRQDTEMWHTGIYIRQGDPGNVQSADPIHRHEPRAALASFRPADLSVPTSVR